MVTEEKNENSDQAEESREELDDAVKLTDFKNWLASQVRVCR